MSGVVDLCRVCGGGLSSLAWVSPGYTGFPTCRTCLYQPGFDATDRGVSYAEWGDRWVSSFPVHAAERRLLRDAAWELFPRTWVVGDLLRIPLTEGRWVLGQVVWLHPRHYRLHVVAESRVREASELIEPGEVPRPDLMFRTSDWALMHGIWTVIGSGPLSGVGEFPQVIVRDRFADGEFHAVDPVTFSRLSSMDIRPERETIAEWKPPIVPVLALTKFRDDLRPYMTFMFTRSLSDARKGAPIGRALEDPMPGLQVAGSSLPQAQWEESVPSPGPRVLPV